jgi:CubicO group peptidase (beta-lactamase class C family)
VKWMTCAFALLSATGCDVAPPSQQPAASLSLGTRDLAEALLADTIAQASRLPRLRSMLILREGHVLTEQRFNNGPPLDSPVNIKSASKSVLSALVGIAIEKGILTGVDQRVLSVLGSDAPPDPDPRLSRLSVQDLLTMRAGLERTSGENYGRWVSSRNWVRFALARPFIDEPGGAMIYSTGSTHLVSAMLTRASGRDTHALMRDWLATPLGISIPPWSRDPQGIYFGGDDMLMSPRSLARFGELYRLGGVIDGQRIIPARWIEESWTPRTVSPWSGGQYGYGWFIGTSRGHPLRFAWGYGGQMLFIVPDLKLTVVMTSDPSGSRDQGHIAALRALLDNGIVPAVERGGAT